MAPKAPKAPKAPAKAKEPPPPPPGPISPAVKLLLLITFGLLCIAVFIVMLHLYIHLSSQSLTHLEPPIKKLKSKMAEGLKNKKFNHANSPQVADEVIQLPTHIENAELNFEERKGKYYTLFRKRARSSGAWRLFEKSLYYISNETKTWHDAESFCKSRDSHLASVLTDKEQKYITAHFNEPAWIGLKDENKDGSWKWTDGSRLLAEFWALGNPSRSEGNDFGDADDDCTSITPMSPSTQNWNSANCQALYRWVCKESLDVDAP